MAETSSTVEVRQEEGQQPAPARQARSINPLLSLRHEMDRLFEDFMPDLWGRTFGRALEPLRRSQPLTPGLLPVSVDVVETDTAYEITAELPGLEEKDIEVSLSEDALVIRGEKREEREEKKRDYHLTERRYGSFQRSFALPAGVDPDKIEARFKKGVLTITLPKSQEAQQRQKRIEVKGG